MLSRIEALYLGILRVVILIVATIALLAALIGVVTGVPLAAKALGFAHDDVRGGTLGQFVSEKKLAGSPSSTGSVAASDHRSLDGRIATAAKSLGDYDHDPGAPVVATWQSAISASMSRIPVARTNDYLDGLVDLTDQLKTSHGRRLSTAQLSEMLDWNQTRFIETSGTVEAKAAADAAKAYVTLTAAAGAFALFILIAFAFLFVKIERSLRIVRTINLEDVRG